MLLLFAQVTDSKGHVLYNKDDATKGKFAFTTEEYDMFEICFESHIPQGMFLGICNFDYYLLNLKFLL